MPKSSIRTLPAVFMFALLMLAIGCSGTDYAAQLNGVWKINKAVTLDNIKDQDTRQGLEMVFKLAEAAGKEDVMNLAFDMKDMMLITSQAKRQGKFTITASNGNVLILAAVEDNTFGVPAGKAFMTVTVIDDKNISVTPADGQGPMEKNIALFMSKVGDDPSTFKP